MGINARKAGGDPNIIGRGFKKHPTAVTMRSRASAGSLRLERGAMRCGRKSCTTYGPKNTVIPRVFGTGHVM